MTVEKITPKTHNLTDAISLVDEMDVWDLLDWNDDLQDLMERLPEDVREVVMETWRNMVKQDFKNNDDYHPAVNDWMYNS